MSMYYNVNVLQCQITTAVVPPDAAAVQQCHVGHVRRQADDAGAERHPQVLDQGRGAQLPDQSPHLRSRHCE